MRVKNTLPYPHNVFSLLNYDDTPDDDQISRMMEVLSELKPLLQEEFFFFFRDRLTQAEIARRHQVTTQMVHKRLSSVCLSLARRRNYILVGKVR